MTAAPSSAFAPVVTAAILVNLVRRLEAVTLP